MQTKIAIVGCGYVGTAIAKVWQQAGHDLSVTTTTPDRVTELAAVANRVVVLKADNRAALQATIADREVVLVCVGKARQAGYRETYLATAEALAAVLPQAPSVRQIIYTSTHSHLGDRQGAWTDEEVPPAPLTENGEIVAATERVLLAMQTATRRVCILRLAGIYGPGRELGKIFSRWVGTTRPGTGEQFINWVHLDDIVGSIAWACDRQLAGIYHIANDSPLPKREFYSRLFAHLGLDPLSWDGQASGPVNNVRLANGKIKATGYQLRQPSFDF